MNYRRISGAISFLCAVVALTTHASVFNVSPSGSDQSGDGTAERPFKTITHALSSGTCRRLAKGRLSDGVTVYLAPGAIYRERVVVGPDAGGGPGVAVTITSDPLNPAIIAPPQSLGRCSGVAAAGVSVYNKGNVTLENQKVTGSGMDSNNDDGISCYADNGQYSNVTIRNCEVSGWGKTGIVIGGWGGKFGFKDVMAEDCRSHDNKNGGMSAWAEVVDGNYNITVRRCKFYNNLGDPNASGHTGSGVVLGGVTKALIEYCVAYNNGERSTTTGGPVAIWCYFASEVTIQYCEAYGNHAVNCDGGGFDLDGGAQSCVIQYCYSHDNDGAGYLICQYSGARAFTNNIVRYNISQNDGRRNGFAGIHFYSAGSNGGLQNTRIYGNTVFNAYSHAVRFQNTSGQTGTRLWNNIFVTTGGKKLVDGSPSTSVAQFQNNCYWSSGGAFSVAGYSTLDAWRAGKGQEKLNTSSVGIALDPKLAQAGAGGTIGDATKLSTLTAYRLGASSPCIDKGLNLTTTFSVNPGSRDFLGNTIPQGNGFDMGACEATGVSGPLLSGSVAAPGQGSGSLLALPVSSLPGPDAAVDLTGRRLLLCHRRAGPALRGR